jgi:hypothetical protein
MKQMLIQLAKKTGAYTEKPAPAKLQTLKDKE